MQIFAATFRKYNSHQNAHSNLKGIEILCLNAHCKAKFTSYSLFKQHILCNYNKIKRNCNQLCKVENCNFSSSDTKLLNKHIKNHLKDCCSGVLCPFAKCSQSNTPYMSANAYIVHVFRHYSTEDNAKILAEDNFSKDHKANENNFDLFNINVQSSFSNFSDTYFSTEVDNNFLDDFFNVTEKEEFSEVKKNNMDLCLNLTTKYNET